MKVVRRVPVTESKFAMWRGAIALAYSDHRLSNSEMDLIHEYWQQFDFSDAQQAQLDKDLHQGIAIENIFGEITDKRDRAHLINFARVLFHIDGDFSEVEQKIWQAIYDKHMLTIDLKAALKAAREEAEAFRDEERLRVAMASSANPLQRAFSYLCRIEDDVF
ncbi:MAG: hypothetical protein SFW63_03745 [Alphaproteobacteria bacterium]|nr:hypothetical protein [Alphaproteobacteria bacterium]